MSTWKNIKCILIKFYFSSKRRTKCAITATEFIITYTQQELDVDVAVDVETGETGETAAKRRNAANVRNTGKSYAKMVVLEEPDVDAATDVTDIKL